MQLRCKRKIHKEKYRMFARDSQMLRYKCHFVISVIAIKVFYCTHILGGSSRVIWDPVDRPYN